MTEPVEKVDQKPTYGLKSGSEASKMRLLGLKEVQKQVPRSFSTAWVVFDTDLNSYLLSTGVDSFEIENGHSSIAVARVLQRLHTMG